MRGAAAIAVAAAPAFSSLRLMRSIVGLLDSFTGTHGNRLTYAKAGTIRAILHDRSSRIGEPTKED
jgi:hypothetical protein